MNKDKENEIIVNLLNKHFVGVPDLETKKLADGTWVLTDRTGTLYARIRNGVAEFSPQGDFSEITRSIVDIETEE